MKEKNDNQSLVISLKIRPFRKHRSRNKYRNSMIGCIQHMENVITRVWVSEV